MGNSSENPRNCKIVYGAMIAKDKENTIEMPPKNSNSISASSIMINGEMDIAMEGNTYIVGDNGEVVARIDNKNPRIMVSKQQSEKESVEAVNRYMKEKGIKTLAEVVEESKVTNIDEYKKGKAVKKASGEIEI